MEAFVWNIKFMTFHEYPVVSVKLSRMFLSVYNSTLKKQYIKIVKP